MDDITVTLPETIERSVGNLITVAAPIPGNTIVVYWSNGAGFSVYEIRDGEKQHELVLLADYDICSDGSYKRLTK